MCIDVTELIMKTDPNLPPGWWRKVVKRMNNNRYDVYIYSPEGKRFRSEKKLQEFLSNNDKLNLTMDQFSFSLTKDKQGPRSSLTKLRRTLSNPVRQQILTRPHTLTILTPLFMIKVFPHPVDQGYVSNEREALKDLQQKVQENQPINFKNFIRREALKTLLSISESDKDNDITDPDERQMTELEELDSYYDFDYNFEFDEDNKNHTDIRKVFDSDSEEEDEMRI